MESATASTFLTKRVRDAITRAANTTAYASGDAILDASDGHLEFDDLVRGQSPFSCSISTARLYSSANVGTKLEADLILFDEDPTSSNADNDPLALTDAEALNVIGVISFLSANWTILDTSSGADGNAVCEAKNIGLVLQTALGNRSVYGILVARNGYVPVSAEVLTVELVATLD